MFNQLTAIFYIIILIILSIFIIYRLKIGKTKEAGGTGLVYAGLVLIFVTALINLLQQQPGYPTWFLEKIYTAIMVGKFLSLLIGLLLFTAGLAIYFSYWGDRDREVANHLEKLKLLENLQIESRYPYPISELLDRILKNLLAGLEEEAGAIFFLNRNQRQFVLTTAAGLSKEEISLLEYYPYGRNIVTQAIEEETPLLSSDFRNMGGKAQLAASRFRSILVMPLISGKDKLGALLLFSQEERRYSREYISIINPVTEWLSEKIEVTRLIRDLGKSTRELESRHFRFEDFFRQIEAVTSSLGESVSPTDFTARCLGLLGSDEVWLLGLVEGRLNIYGGTKEKSDFSDNFKTALLSALSKNKAVILNQEGRDELGNAIIARSSVLIPADTRGNAILFRNNNGLTTVADFDLKTAKMVAAIGGLIIANGISKHASDSRSRAIEFIVNVLKIKMTWEQIETSLKALVQELAGIVPPDSVFLLYKRQGEHFKVAHSNSNDGEFGELIISIGEGTTGKTAVVKANQFVSGAASVAENLISYDEENVGILNRLFGDRGKPIFQADYPIMVKGQVESIFSIFGFQDSPLINMELHRLLSVLIGLFNLRIEVCLINSVVPAESSPPELETLTVSQINEINNDLAAISGYCQMARRDLNLTGEVANSFDSILNITEGIARKVKSFLPEKTAEGKAVENLTDINLVTADFFRHNGISGNLYMIGGRPFEVNLNLKDIPALGIDADAFESFLDSASRTFTENVAEDEIITIGTYPYQDRIYVDISRHRKNFPPVEPVAAFGRYLLPNMLESLLKSKDFISQLTVFEAEFAYDKYSRIPSYFSFRFSQKSTIQFHKEKKPVHSEPISILAVDDQVVILELLAAMCQSMGYKIVTARNGHDALDLFEIHRPEIVIADLFMSGMNGLELAAKIKSLSPSTQIIMITGWGATVDREKLSMAGVDSILHKPFRMEQLADLIAKARSSSIRS
ncbi:MAG: response regulator [candidate division Zixibacteria bacterium]|nr:response regulator [candidate division Zixibacteria bacterium]